MIVAASMMVATRQAQHEPLWFVILLTVGMLAFCVWGIYALWVLERGK